MILYDRDSAGRVIRVRMTDGGVTSTLASSVSHLPFGPLGSVVLGNTVQSTRTFDLDYRVTSLAGGLQFSRQYTYGSRDEITSTTGTDGTGAYQSFGYDSALRLTSAFGPYGTFSWTYDADGNRLKEIHNISTSDYAYVSGTNRLQSITSATSVDPLVLLSQTATTLSFGYDSAGNTLSKGKYGFQIDDSGRLTGMDQRDPIGVLNPRQSLFSNQTYTLDGLRHARTEGGVKRRFTYDQRGHLLAEMSDSGTVLAEYVWFDDRPLALVTNRAGSPLKEVFYYETDHLNTPIQLTDANGLVAWSARYEPFGKTTPTIELVKNSLRMPGQYDDNGTGIYQNWFRDYDPSIGRYLESDPVGLRGGINTYNYVKNNPISNVDPSGLGPRAFGICTAFNAGYTIGSFFNTMEDLDSTGLLQEQLIRVNKEISECSSDDTTRMEGLNEIKNDLVKTLRPSVGRIASENNTFFGLGDVGSGMARESICSLLLLPQVPLP